MKLVVPRGGGETEKTTDGVGCLNTLMNSLNEDISVKKLRERNSKAYETANKLSNPLSTRGARIDLIMRNAQGRRHNALRGRMWSFVNTLGSHSLHTKLKTHYSEQLHSYNNPLI